MSRNLEQALDALQMAKMAGKPNPDYDQITIKGPLVDRYDDMKSTLSPAALAEVRELVEAFTAKFLGVTTTGGPQS